MVINQLSGMYECKDDILRGYYEKCQSLIDKFPMVTIRHILRAWNQETNKLAQGTSGYRQIQEILSNEVTASDWRKEIVNYLRNPS